MFKRLPLPLPRIPNTSKLMSKIALGTVLLTFLLNYQPAFSFPPVKQNLVHAQESQPVQIQTVSSDKLPIVFSLPHQGYISTHFSSYHPGIDIATPLGTPIHPVAEGVVESAGYDFWGLGLNVVVKHVNGYESLYAHMAVTYVKKGDQVTTDNMLGEVGLTGHTTGPHTHLQISKDGTNIDPQPLLPALRDYPTIADFTPSVQTLPQKETIKETAPAASSTPAPTPVTLDTTVKINQVANLTENKPVQNLLNQLPL